MKSTVTGIIIVDLVKAKARRRIPRSNINEIMIPLRNANRPRGHIRTQRVKQVNIRAAEKKAVEMITGLMCMTLSKRGPSPNP